MRNQDAVKNVFSSPVKSTSDGKFGCLLLGEKARRIKIASSARKAHPPVRPNESEELKKLKGDFVFVLEVP
jgi:hypothetical protein